MVRATLPFAALALLLGCHLAAQDVHVRPVVEYWMPSRPDGERGPPDSNSPAFWRNGRLFWYGSNGSAWLSEGPHQFGPWKTRRVSIPSRDPSPKWVEDVWPEYDQVLWGWYHVEPPDLIPGTTYTAPKIGAAVSFDGGYTMNDLGYVLASGDPLDPTPGNRYFAGGHGDACVIRDRQGEYFYFFFGNYGGPAGSQGVGVARMAFGDRANPTQAVWKYHRGAWQERGIGGALTPIFAAERAWDSGDPDAFWGPSVHWNRHLNCYVMLLNRARGRQWSQEGIYISFNADLSRPEDWTPPRKILGQAELNDPGAFYPQVMGAEPGDTNRSAGRTARLYVHGVSRWELEFVAPPTAPTSVNATIEPGTVPDPGAPVLLSVSAMGAGPFTYQWIKDGVPMAGATAPTFEIAAFSPADAGVYAVIVTNALGTTLSNRITLGPPPPPVAPPPAGFLSNLSVRTRLDGGDRGLVLGLALRARAPKPVLVRAIGPTLAQFGIDDAARDPRLTVFDAAFNPMAMNDDWLASDAPVFAAAGAFALPAGSADAALVVEAPTGTATAAVTATGPGMVLAEIYDPEAAIDSEIVNLSARAWIGRTHPALVGGFTVRGSGSKQLLLRALGPQLAAYGVGDALASPLLEVYDASGTLLMENAGWEVALEPEFTRAGASSLAPGSRDAAIVMTVPAGSSYTCVVRSADGSSGEALLEIYSIR